MGKKVRCCDCNNLMDWAVPVIVTDTNYEYCREFLVMAKNIQQCSVYGRGRRPNRERHCKYFERKKVKCSIMNGDIENLEKLLAEYEKEKGLKKNERTGSD